MFLSQLRVEGFRVFGSVFEMPLNAGLNVLAGENDSGKTAIVDAIRLALGTTSQDFQRVQDDDFHFAGGERASEFSIRCKFEGIDEEAGGAFLEHLTHRDGTVCLYVNFKATLNEAMSARRRITVSVRSGRDGDGPILEANVRLLLQATYLRPLRDAERELDAGRNSRLSQILQFTKEITAYRNEDFDPAAFVAAVENKEETKLPKSFANVSRLADHLIQENEGVKKAGERLDSSYLAHLNLGVETMKSKVSVGRAATEEQRLRAVLEKLDLRLATEADPSGQLPHGLGYNNLLFMACELLLLGQERDTLPLLLIEEPEAHLHPQLQLRLVEFLQAQADDEVGPHVQIIVTTHSPNLASKVKLKSMILVHQGEAFPLEPAFTMLSEPDYRFLERFLDVTKANLFFARGVLIVEGDAENLLLPTLARLLGKDLTEHGVAIVNVGSRGLRRYARIFRRRPLSDSDLAHPIPVRVACLADRDIKPDCAKEALDQEDREKGSGSGSVPRYECDLASDDEREQLIQNRSRDDGGGVRTFVSDYWTLEYDIARAGLGSELWRAVALAKDERRRDRGRGDGEPSNIDAVLAEADEKWQEAEEDSQSRSGSAEFLACKAYEPLYRRQVSKSMVAQHLANHLEEACGPGSQREGGDEIFELVPPYIRRAIEYVTGRDAASQPDVESAMEQVGNPGTPS